MPKQKLRREATNRTAESGELGKAKPRLGGRKNRDKQLTFIDRVSISWNFFVMSKQNSLIWSHLNSAEILIVLLPMSRNIYLTAHSSEMKFS